MHFSLPLSFRLVGGLLAIIPAACATEDDRPSAASAINQTLIDAARLGLYAVQRPSWVQGTAMSAILEYEGGPVWSLWSNADNGPVYSRQRGTQAGVRPQGPPPLGLYSMAYHGVSAQDQYGRLCAFISAEEVLAAGASLDSANCASGVLIAAFDAGQIVNGVNTGGYYGDAATKQLTFVTKTTKRSATGAISQRNSGIQVWSDSFYMGSSLGFYGMVYDDKELLQLAYDQMRIYRDTLLQPSSGLMAHIYDFDTSSFQDGNVWVTGNGWAAAGMLRVLASIIQSSHAEDMEQQRIDLYSWTAELLDAAYNVVDPATGLWHNYMNNTNTFLDASGSMLLAYSTFRLASLTSRNKKHVPAAEKIYQLIQGNMDRVGHFNDAITTVNALNFATVGPSSGESLAFAIMLSSARRDYHARNVTGFDGPNTANEPPPSVSTNTTTSISATVPSTTATSSILGTATETKTSSTASLAPSA